MKRPRQAPRTGQGGQEKKGEYAECKEERKDDRKDRGGEAPRKQRPAGRAGLERGAGQGRGAQNTSVSFLNHRGVRVSNKDKGGNDYSVKSMALDCANTN